ncbi:hypothetical protein BPNPMPFG_003437 [Mesorhizobium sp. AR07]|uniref:hypothetical protein n=1 Tax=Mesorhizobium sp. AR07 TaxID=2865838 RepID=UPI002160EAB9|nr:hypothetical protein [Mesorhizobium sp. AR07]UVK41839.1 hypothetical protein BPNPMPFG_003437 [Mesorhizobium sp. AR07]
MIETQNPIKLWRSGASCDAQRQPYCSQDILSDDDAFHTKTSGCPLHLVTDAAVAPDTLKGGVILLGNFDGFHRGHQALLDVATEQAGLKPIGVMSVEPHPRQLFAPEAGAFRLSTPASKMETFSRFGMSFLYSPRFDHSFASQQPEQFVDDILVCGLGISHLVVGRDFRFGARRRGDVNLLRCMGQNRGFSVTAVDEIEWGDVRCSSTLVRNLLLAGNIEDANEMLGYNWGFEVDLPSEAIRQSGEWTTRWPEALLIPERGRYEVALRRIGETIPLLSGRITIDSPGRVMLSLDSPLHVASAAQPSLFIDFLARSRK